MKSVEPYLPISAIRDAYASAIDHMTDSDGRIVAVHDVGSLDEVAAQRWAEVDGAEWTVVIGTPQVLTSASTVSIESFTTTTGRRAVSTGARRQRSHAPVMRR